MPTNEVSWFSRGMTIPSDIFRLYETVMNKAILRQLTERENEIFTAVIGRKIKYCDW